MATSDPRLIGATAKLRRYIEAENGTQSWLTKAEAKALLELANSYEFDVNIPIAELREQAERLHGALMAAAGLLERLGAWFIETKPPASKAFEVEIVDTIARIISDLQERDSGL